MGSGTGAELAEMGCLTGERGGISGGGTLLSLWPLYGRPVLE